VILTDREIQIALGRKQIDIDPAPDLDAYSSTSVDLTLGQHITEFDEELLNGPIETAIDPSHENFVAERTLTKITKQMTIDPKNGYLLIPKKLVLGWTAERVELPIHSRLAARVEGKSSLARLGLGVHVTAPTIHSGFANPIRLEIINHGAAQIRLRTGMRICQLIFEGTFGTPQKGFQQVQSAPFDRPSTPSSAPGGQRKRSKRT
jgi:dCTP deaminase